LGSNSPGRRKPSALGSEVRERAIGCTFMPVGKMATQYAALWPRFQRR
jgi:hypothetical protein